MSIGVSRYGDWVEAKRLLSLRQQPRMRAIWHRALLQEAHAWRKELVTGVTSQAPGGKKFKKLSPLTLAKRKHSGFKGRKALLRSGTFRRNITVVDRGSGVFVGVLRAAKSSDGRSLVNIARVHEEGRTVVIRVTEKMRKYFFAMLRGGLSKKALKKGGKSSGGFKRGILVIQIPARPVFAPVYAKMTRPRSALVKRMKRRVSLLSKGDFGLV